MYVFYSNVVFTDINECSPDPCNTMFECEDRINEYHCKLIGWKLALIIVISLLVVLMVAIFIFLFETKLIIIMIRLVRVKSLYFFYLNLPLRDEIHNLRNFYEPFMNIHDIFMTGS